MVQARPPLIEGLARVSVVMMQPEHDARTRLHQNDRVAALLPAMMRENHWQPGHPEDPLIPLRACLHIGDGRREVVVGTDRWAIADSATAASLLSFCAAQLDAASHHAASLGSRPPLCGRYP